MKEIAFVYNDNKNSDAIDYIEGIIMDIFGEYAVKKRYFLNGLEPEERISADAILVNGNNLIYSVMRHADDRHNVIRISRSIRKDQLEKVRKIPEHTRVMVVNDTLRSTMETIFTLYELGIIQYDLFPFVPGINDPTDPTYEGIEYAVTPSELESVPSTIPHVIDLKYRVVGLDTLLKLMHRLDLDNTAVNAKVFEYIDAVAEPTMDFYDNYVDSYIKTRVMDQLADDTLSAILAVDRENHVIFANRKARDIFPDETLPELPEDRDSRLLTIGSANYLVDWHPLMVGSLELGRVITLKDEEVIRNTETEFRQRMVERGFYAKYTFSDIICQSEEMADCLNKARRAARTDHTILIRGESGTGKELIAQSIHNYSGRARQPFVAVNCAALTESLLESELFGYEPGSFTGAQKKGKIGLFERANHGTIFLDEIGDISAKLQARLLRVIQERQVMRIGSDKVIDVDVRILTATNKNLEELVINRIFREDLYYRLNVISLHVPALRERKSDILPLLSTFLGKKAFRQVTDAEKKRLLEYSWPGNVRELQNAATYYQMMGEFPALEAGSAVMDGRVPAKAARTGAFRSDSPREQIEHNLLDLLYQHYRSFRTTGRTEMLQYLKEQGFAVSDVSLRKILREMAEDGLVIVERGRKGTTITEAGIGRIRE